MKRLLEGQQLQRTVPPTAGRVEPVVRLPGGLTLDDRRCWWATWAAASLP